MQRLISSTKIELHFTEAGTDSCWHRRLFFPLFKSRKGPKKKKKKKDLLTLSFAFTSLARLLFEARLKKAQLLSNWKLKHQKDRASRPISINEAAQHTGEEVTVDWALLLQIHFSSVRNTRSIFMTFSFAIIGFQKAPLQKRFFIAPENSSWIMSKSAFKGSVSKATN